MPGASIPCGGDTLTVIAAGAASIRRSRNKAPIEGVTLNMMVQHLPMAQQTQSMKFWPVTSVMKTGQCKRYMDAMHIRYSERGVELTIPEDDYSAPGSPPGDADSADLP